MVKNLVLSVVIFCLLNVLLNLCILYFNLVYILVEKIFKILCKKEYRYIIVIYG